MKPKIIRRLAVVCVRASAQLSGGTMKVVQTLFLVAAMLMMTDVVSAQNWTQMSAPVTNWVAVASSADGGKLVAAANGGYGGNNIKLPGPIYISTNSGYTWIQATNAPSADWRSVAISADGNRLIAVAYGGGIYRSVDSGLTWVQTGAVSNYWISVASSADGNKLSALAMVFPPPDFYTSSDSGATWTAKTSPYDRWLALASSAEGNTLVACGGLGTALASTDSGNSWSTNFNGAATSVASSADGSRLVEMGYGKIYISTNSGLAWIQSNAPPAYEIASSADGRKLVAGGGSTIYISTDCGATWVTNTLSGPSISSVASSADGGKLVAVANGGGIWTTQTIQAPQIKLSLSGTTSTLSWVIPSTNFILQKSADLTPNSWMGVLSMPTLNLTNLQEQLTFSSSNSSSFYRLKTP